MKTKTHYKGTNKEGKCQGFQYKIGGEYEHKGTIGLCYSGFHACPNPLDVFSYYPPNGNNRFFEVEQSGDTIKGDDKIVSQHIKIITTGHNT